MKLAYLRHSDDVIRPVGLIQHENDLVDKVTDVTFVLHRTLHINHPFIPHCVVDIFLSRREIPDNTRLINSANYKTNLNDEKNKFNNPLKLPTSFNAQLVVDEMN